MKFLSDYTNMQIHLCPSPSAHISADDAATKIQAGFRGYRVRKQLKENRNSSNTSDNRIENSENIQNYTNIIGNQQNGKQWNANGNYLIDETLLTREEKCATKIQAGVRGFLVRKKQKVASNAATKIQAGFRGFRARKEFRKLKA